MTKNNKTNTLAPVKALTADRLYQCCVPEEFDFETTDDLKDLTEVIGQPRAVKAMEFGVEIEQEGYNIFALGVPGTGKRSLVRRLFEEQVINKPVPPDWCYVNNFSKRR